MKDFAGWRELILSVPDSANKSFGSNPAPTDPAQAIRAALEQELEERPAEPKPASPTIPDHTLIGRIGAGAYGEVFLARSALGSLRAVKVVYREKFEDHHPYEREFNGIVSYEPISRTHEGLVAVLHAGCNDAAGYFYYVMELADNASADCRTRAAASKAGGKRPTSHSFGVESTPATGSPLPDAAHRAAPWYAPRTLREELQHRGPLPAADAARIAARIATALAHLHAHGLVHRDIKPSNIVFIQGQPKLADIGLVAGAGDSRSFVGTEGFIPPEGPGTVQADLYGLGKLLYELATGRDRLDFPQLPLGLTDTSSGESLLELNEVITRACAPDAQDRYRTATEMLADLNLFLAGRSLREAGKLQRRVAWLKRFVAAACVGLVLAGAAVWAARESERQSQAQARVESVLRQRAEAAERDSRQQLYAALLEEARGLTHSGQMGQRVRTLEVIRRAAGISNSPALRAVALAALALPDLRFTREVPQDPDIVGAELSPAFDRVALCHRSGPVQSGRA